MPLSPTRASRRPETAVLVYDGECPFCAATANWIQRRSRAPLRILSFDELTDDDGLLTRLTDEEVVATAHFITTGGIEYHGGQAITRALRLVRFGWLAGVLDVPGFSLLRNLGYILADRMRPLLSKIIHP